MDRECLYLKIFRPWASASSVSEENKKNVIEQDATISTTTSMAVTSELETKKQQASTVKDHEIVHRPEASAKSKTSKLIGRQSAASEITPPADWYDASSQSSMFAALGLTATDAILLEAASLAHGHAAEEYARVLLGEEQRARLHAAARKQRPKKYKCPHCDVGFSNNGQLKGHIRIHTGERPFRCDVTSCGKTFTRNEELTRHKRIHSGLRPFACTECGKRFGRKDHLKKHARTHAQHRAAATIAAVYGMPYHPQLGIPLAGAVMPLPHGMAMQSTPMDAWMVPQHLPNVGCGLPLHPPPMLYGY